MVDYAKDYGNIYMKCNVWRFQAGYRATNVSI